MKAGIIGICGHGQIHAQAYQELGIKIAYVVDIAPSVEEIESFIRCLKEGKSPPVTLQDGLEATKIAEKILESLKTGEKIKLEQ